MAIPGKYTHKYPLNSFKSWSDPCQYTQLNLHFFLNPHFDELLNPSKSKSILDPMFDLLDPLVKSHGSGPPRLNSSLYRAKRSRRSLRRMVPRPAMEPSEPIRTHQRPIRKILNTIKHHQSNHRTSSNIMKHHEESSDFSQFSPDFPSISHATPPPGVPGLSPLRGRGTEAFPVALHHGVDAPQLLHGGRSIVAGPRGVMGFKL